MAKKRRQIWLKVTERVHEGEDTDASHEVDYHTSYTRDIVHEDGSVKRAKYKKGDPAPVTTFLTILANLISSTIADEMLHPQEAMKYAVDLMQSVVRQVASAAGLTVCSNPQELLEALRKEAEKRGMSIDGTESPFPRAQPAALQKEDLSEEQLKSLELSLHSTGHKPIKN